MQVVYPITSAYFEDDCADELANEPVMAAILDKDALAPQPTLPRFFNHRGIIHCYATVGWPAIF